MASAVKRNQTYGNVAYDTGRLGTFPSRRGPQLQELPLVRPRRRSQEQVQTRVKVALRPKEEYSIVPMLGFVLAGLMAVMILMGYVQLDAIYADTVEARDQLSTLQAEEVQLLAQYEEVFDQSTLQAAIENADVLLSEASNSQKVYVDLSEPDNAVVYNQSGENDLLQALKDLWSSLTA